jgi:phage terminase large subunit
MTKVEIVCPEKLLFFHDEAWRFKVARGGRGSAKSWSVADAALVRSATRTRQRILCAREFQRSIKDSVHYLLASQIERLGLGGAFRVIDTEITCKATGSQFIFAGLHHNISSLKSLEAIDVCWVEEAEVVSEESWSKLIPTIRKPGSEIWVTFNPDQESDPTYRRFVPGQPQFDPTRTKSEMVSWRDNPCLPDVLRDELEHLRRTDPEAYAHIWEGGTWARSDAQIFNGKWLIDDFEPAEDWDGPYFGADWGFSRDPTVLVKVWLNSTRLFIEYDEGGVGIPIVAKKPGELDTAKLFDRVPGSRTRKIRADKSRPETINHMAGAGFDIEAAAKWPGSVEDGISYLRGFDKIVLHPRCRRAAEEFRLYSYKVDRLTGDVLPDIVDRHNHVIDAIRYALEPIISQEEEAPTGIRVRFPM